MKTKLLHIWYDMRHQPVIAWVTLVATALSIFLIMVVLIVQRVGIVPYAPESCRDRLLAGAFFHRESIEGDESSSASLSYATASELYSGLEGIERISFMRQWSETGEIKVVRGAGTDGLIRLVDGEFFNIFDHTLLKGRYFTKEESDALVKVCVITESVARKILPDREWIGAELLVEQRPYTVIGVIKDHSKLATTAAGDVFVPTGKGDPLCWEQDEFGSFYVALLMKDGVKPEDIKSQVKARYANIATRMAPNNQRPVYHEAPFTQEVIADGLSGSNTTPDLESGRQLRLLGFAILLLVPAINLSSMLHSRMRRRINEIGVQRAFGCTRMRVITDILTENFLVTLAGGIIGLVLGIIFATTYSGLYENMDNVGSSPTPAISATLNWATVAIAVGVCFLLNLISAAIPAWQAARMNPVEAINKK